MTNGFIKCLMCNGQLLPSGVEVHRYICESCGQNYHAVLQFIPVEPIRRSKGLIGDAGGSPISDGGSEIPKTIR